MVIEEPIDTGAKCVCGKWMIVEHTCPYSEELHGDKEPCKCCSYCEYQCCMDI